MGRGKLECANFATPKTAQAKKQKNGILQNKT
jgi:hypothetical protein